VSFDFLKSLHHLNDTPVVKGLLIFSATVVTASGLTWRVATYYHAGELQRLSEELEKARSNAVPVSIEPQKETGNGPSAENSVSRLDYEILLTEATRLKKDAEKNVVALADSQRRLQAAASLPRVRDGAQASASSELAALVKEHADLLAKTTELQKQLVEARRVNAQSENAKRTLERIDKLQRDRSALDSEIRSLAMDATRLKEEAARAAVYCSASRQAGQCAQAASVKASADERQKELDWAKQRRQAMDVEISQLQRTLP